ncbi:ABC transporter permease [Paenibacillus thiaminolyticus]|uniref:ABC transporter permease n=1 Tax=Paenibacillus thiaminolyticus TaxID=49283 RepID=A0AAP9DSI2_PANTH|nr:ABC transporter permease [Paenibacillus thiaminolyticus]MCY9533435.1 ABC transporter permease [Paenibacillus thiaminolyticus]MCY9604100.1 ABC transporter permease [Paenibacillus thiaminolyticus]MCY9606352.1 ABC transporter permease [Paenibacillus thiaminolyticus]MCY9612102.1 ABC transporter permease [Paenibacillus thiaminolyticus]MCY9618123.1 ABC transporter permease [Paenibacillus thiaminolyticus]
MLRYISQRLVAMAITLFLIISLLFFLIHSMPGSIVSDPMLPLDVKERIEAKYHLDKPLVVQYVYFLQDFLTFNFGDSIKMQPNVPVFNIIKDKLPITIQLNIFALVFTLPIGIMLGIWAALKKNTATDHTLNIMVVLFISVPSFVFAALLQYIVAFKWELVPILLSAEQSLSWTKLQSMILPVLALSFGEIAIITRYLRAELCEALNSDYMLLARTKGLTLRQATLRHAIRNSFVPLANIIIPLFFSILSGAIVIENIFGVPGLGSLMINSITALDHPLTIAIMFFYSLIGLISILVVDLSYGIIDPRIRMGGKK